MNNSNRISEYLSLRQMHQGQIHIDYLKIPNTYPKDLFCPSPQLIREDLEKYQTNLIPLIIRPVNTTEGDTEYEVIFGKEVVEFARELGIDQLWASRIELRDEEVRPFQERFKSIFQIHSSKRTEVGNQEIQSITLLLEHKFNQQNERIENLLQKTKESLLQEIKEIARNLEKLETNFTESQKTLQEIKPTKATKQSSIKINSYKNAENLKKRVPSLTLEEARKIIQQIKKGQKFTSVDELKAIAPSGQWHEVNLSLSFSL